MLSRAARRKHALQYLPRPFSRRTALASTKLRFYSQSIRPNIVSNTDPTPSHERPRRPSFQSSRHLATAADHVVTEASPYGSFDPGFYTSEPSFDLSKQWGSLFQMPNHELDPSSLIILDQYAQTRPRILRKVRGIGGDEEEMLANFDISLKVGRLDRAAALLQRLKHYFPVESEEFLDLNNRYLEGMVSHMILTRRHDTVSTLQRWFEVEMRHGGVNPNETTFATMIKMSLRMLHGTKRDRTVRRYWEMAKDQRIEEEVLASPILSELELGELSEICSSDLQRLAIETPVVDANYDNLPTGQKYEDSVPIRAVDQKGHGLSSLRQSLSLFSDEMGLALPSKQEGESEEQLASLQNARQRRLEANALQSALNRWRHEFRERQKFGTDMSASGNRISSMMHEWHSGLVDRIRQELNLVAEAEANPIRTVEQRERCEYGVYLQALDPEKIAALTILNIWSTFSQAGMDKGVKLSFLATSIGKDFRDELLAETVLKKDSGCGARRLKHLKHVLAGRKRRAGRNQWDALVRKLQDQDPTVVWPSRTVAKVGAVLMSMLFETANIRTTAASADTNQRVFAKQPAFQHVYQLRWGKRSGVIHMHPELVKMAAKEPPADLVCRHLPMVCEPRPWKGLKDGGFQIYETSLLRLTPGEILQPQYVEAALQTHGLEHVRSGLDVLGKTPWVINKDVFNVMVEAWNSGDAVANLPPLEPDFDQPPKPLAEEGPEAEGQWIKTVRELENKKSGLHSNRCFQNFQMEVARAYLNEAFYLPHNIDFRGRAYPLPPYLNQMGADNCRGILLFKDAKPLGDNGLRWLKIQLANVFGYDKASLSEREQFTMDHLEDVLDSANSGLHGRRWWLKAEDPWQCLAACFELRNALQLPDPTRYESRLPIHQDGSCNGLQHYAALGGDIVGAKQVNLEPSDRPSDVYTGVAEFVKEIVAKEAAQGDPVALMLRGKVTRKVVKQTVMTNVYGVTFIGAMRQVRKQLIDHYPELSSDETRAGALYIAKKIFHALGSMFHGAHQIQSWLGDCASRITQSLSPEQIDEIAAEALTFEGDKDGGSKAQDPSKRFRSTVIWTTPLGLPVVQPYRTRKARRINTSLQDISLYDSTAEDVVNKRRQLQAFPPNFIHSLDATHMLLSANECHRNGLTFSAVHDSFWTHACDVDQMNDILREAFVRMHSDSIVKRLAAEFDARYGRHLFYARIDSSSEIARAIRKHRSSTNKNQAKVRELLKEQQRQNLLNSDDPELQAQGRAMTTAASIFEEMNGCDDDLDIRKSLGALDLAHIPEDVEAAERQPLFIDTEDPALGNLVSDLEAEAGSDSIATEEGEGEDAAEAAPAKGKKRAGGGGRSHVWLWLPLRFREVPTKGAWDITRIRDSKYFFS